MKDITSETEIILIMKKCYNLSRLQKCCATLDRQFFFQNFIITEREGGERIFAFKLQVLRQKMSSVN